MYETISEISETTRYVYSGVNVATCTSEIQTENN